MISIQCYCDTGCLCRGLCKMENEQQMIGRKAKNLRASVRICSDDLWLYNNSQNAYIDTYEKKYGREK